MSHTHTYAILPVSRAAYDEIRAKLVAAGYRGAIHDEFTQGEVIDMHGIALQVEPAPPLQDCPNHRDFRETHRGPSLQHATDEEAARFRGKCGPAQGLQGTDEELQMQCEGGPPSPK